MSRKQRVKHHLNVILNPSEGSSNSSITQTNDGKQLFWGAFALLIIAQLIFTLNSMGQIRYEELAESVRNVFWLQNHTVYDGVSSNIGWYGSLLLIYKIFGFSINTAKFFRLFLQILALLSAALIFRKYLSYKQSIVPLLVIGLSPTILYLNTMQDQIGVDLEYATICLYLTLSLRGVSNYERRGNLDFFIKSLFLWAIAMLAWMSYPTFVFYLLPLALIYLWQLKNIISNTKTLFYNIIASFIGFLLPLITGLLYLKNIQLVLYDNVTKSGIFRGAGAFQFDFSLFFNNLTSTLNDLFYKGQSYQFELPQADFSNLYPVISIILIFGLGFSLLTHRKLRIYLIAIFILIFSNIILSSFTIDPSHQPGIRRTTGVLFGIYALYTICWGYILKHNFNNKNNKIALIIILIFIPLHHLITFPENLMSLSNPSIYAENQWFKLSDTPAKSLDIMVKAVQQDELKLGCKDPQGQNFIPCRYSEVYAAVAGYCEWNKLECHDITGYDLATKQQIPLSIDLWESYQIQH